MSSSDHFQRKEPTKKQLELLSKITNPEQKKTLIAAIESGEEIPDYAWEPIPDSFSREKLIEIAMEAKKAGEQFRKMEEETSLKEMPYDMEIYSLPQEIIKQAEVLTRSLIEEGFDQASTEIKETLHLRGNEQVILKALLSILHKLHLAYPILANTTCEEVDSLEKSIERLLAQ